MEGAGPPLLMIMGWIGHAGFWGEAFLEPLRPHFRSSASPTAAPA